MRKIEAIINGVISNKGNKTLSNTTVFTDILNNVTRVYLHGNLIAKFEHKTKKRYFTLAGWNTVTTRSRLNALGANITQKNFAPYFNGKEISMYKWYEF